jgi:hypothetical protein
MTPPDDVQSHRYEPTLSLESLAWRVSNNEQRIAKIEATKPEMMADALQRLTAEMRAFRRSLNALIVGVAVALVVYIVQKYAGGAAAGVMWWHG